MRPITKLPHPDTVCGRHHGQRDAERRAPGRGGGVDVSIVRVHDLADDGQAEAGALRLGGEERTEYAIEIVGGDARTVIANFDDHLGGHRIGDRLLILTGLETRAYLDVALSAQG